jgi:hypothetical protein
MLQVGATGIEEEKEEEKEEENLLVGFMGHMARNLSLFRKIVFNFYICTSHYTLVLHN